MEKLRSLRRRFEGWRPRAFPVPDHVLAWVVVAVLILIVGWLLVQNTLGGAVAGSLIAGPGPGTVAGSLAGAAATIAALVAIRVLLKRMLDSQEAEARRRLASIGMDDPRLLASQDRPPQGMPEPPPIVLMRTIFGA